MIGVISRDSSYEAYLLILDRKAGHSGMTIQRAAHQSTLQTDSELQEWLFSGTGAFALPGGYELTKSIK